MQLDAGEGSSGEGGPGIRGVDAVELPDGLLQLVSVETGSAGVVGGGGRGRVGGGGGLTRSGRGCSGGWRCCRAGSTRAASARGSGA